MFDLSNLDMDTQS